MINFIEALSLLSGGIITGFINQRKKVTTKMQRTVSKEKEILKQEKRVLTEQISTLQNNSRLAISVEKRLLDIIKF